MVMQPLRPVPYALSTIEMSQHVWSIPLQDESKRTSLNNTASVTDAGYVWSDTYWQIICTCTHCDGTDTNKTQGVAHIFAWYFIRC
jgi:hypothetical protein